jgi:flagellar FliL protein
MGLYDSKTSNGSDSEFSQRRKIAIGVIILIALFIGGGYFLYESKQGPSNESKALIKDSKVAHEKVDELAKQEELKNNTIKQDSSLTDKKIENTYLQVDKEFMTNLKDSKKVMVIQIALMTHYDNRVFDNFKKHEFTIRSAIMDVIRQTTESEVVRPSFRNELTSKIKIIINNVLVKYEDFGGIDDVFFTSFVIN